MLSRNLKLCPPSQLAGFEKKLELHYAVYSARHDLIIAQCSSAQIEDQDLKLDEFYELHTDSLVKLNQLVNYFRAKTQQHQILSSECYTTANQLSDSYFRWDVRRFAEV